MKGERARQAEQDETARRNDAGETQCGIEETEEETRRTSRRERSQKNQDRGTPTRAGPASTKHPGDVGDSHADIDDGGEKDDNEDREFGGSCAGTLL